MSLATIASSLFFLVAPTPGDVVPPEPQPATCHGGPFCAGAACSTDADCSGGLSCQEVELCLGSIGCAGLLPPDADPSDYDQERVLGACDASCANCQPRKVCAEGASPGGSGGSGGAAEAPPGGDTTPGSQTDDDDEGCASAPTESAAALALALLALAWSRRRRPAR